MDKKLLVSLMMTAPVAAFAQANWSSANGLLSYSIKPEANPANWTPNGLADFGTPSGNILVCPVAAGSMSHNAVLPQGKYNFSCAYLENAILKVNGKYLVKTNDKGQYVDAAGKVTADIAKMIPLNGFTATYDVETMLAIELVPVQKDLEFKVGEVTIALDFNFATVKSSLQSALDAISFNDVIAEDNRQEAAALVARKAKLTGVAAGIQGEIDDIDLGNGDALKAAYVKYILSKWDSVKPGDKISGEIAALAADAKAYNTDVDNENAIWNNILKNTADLKALNNDLIALQQQLDNKKAEIDGIILNDPASGKLGEYCKFITSKDIADAQAAIDAYKAKIDAAYKDLTKKVNFASETEKISGQISAINYDQAKADWNAYGQFLKDAAEVQNEYGRIFALVNDIEIPLKGVTGNVYEDVIGVANIDLAKIYNNNAGYAINAEGGQTPDNANIAGAAENLKAAQEDMQARKDAMQKILDDLNALVEAQEAQWKDAQAEIKDLQDAKDNLASILDNPVFGDLSAKDQKTVKDNLDNIQKAIDALKAEAQKEYLAHELDTEGKDYKDKVAAVDNANKKFNDETAGFDAVLDLMIDFEKAKNYVKTETGKAKIAEYGLASKFDETFVNIQNATDKFYANQTDAARTDIEKSIQGVFDTCDALVSSFIAAVDQISAADKALTAFEKTVNDKTVVTINGKAAYNKGNYKYSYNNEGAKSLTVASVKAALADYKAQLKAIAAGTDNKYKNPQDAYAAANSVSATIVKDNYAKYVPEAEKDFVKVVTDANLKAVQNVADDITKKKAEAPYATAAGMDKVSVDLELPKDYKGAQNVEEAAGNVTAAAGDAKKLAACDSDLVVLAAAYDKVYDQIKKVVNNYDTYMDLLGDAALVQTKLNEFSNSIPENTVEPAVTHYNKEVEKLQKELDDIKKAISDSYNAVTEVADEPDHTADLNALTGKIKATDEALQLNQKKYDEQVATAKDLANKANALIDWLKANDLVPANLNKYLEEIAGVTDDLANLNVDLTKSFGIGESAKRDPEYKGKFADLEQRLKDIYNAETNGYEAAVDQANNDYLASQGVVEGGLDKQYLDAIAWVNEYRYDIKNPGYYNALILNEKFKENHQKLQDCYAEINKLEETIKTFVSGLTVGTDRKDWIVLTNNNVTVNKIKLQDVVDEAARIKALIEDTLAALDAAAENVADTYYAAQSGSAQTKYDSIKSRLLAAGLSADTLDKNGKVVPGEVSKAMNDVTIDLTSATRGYKGYQDAIANPGKDMTEAEAIHAYILGMSGICDNLDKVNDVDANKFVKEAIDNQWNTNFNAAVKTIDGYISQVEGYDQAQFQADYLMTLQAQLSLVYGLDYEWSDLTTAQREAQFGLFDNSNDQHDNLEDLLAAAKDIVDTAKAEHELAVANSNALKVLITNSDSYLNKTQSALDELLAWSGYRDTQLATISGLQGDIDALVNIIKSNVAAADANLENYKDRFTKIQKAIEAAYETVFTQEQAFANELMLKTRSAFNNAKKAGVAQDILDGYDKQIKDLTKALDLVKYNAKDKTACHDELFAIEDQLAALMDVLEELGRTGSVTTDTYEDALKDLNKTFDDLNENFSALKNNIETKGAAAGTYGQEVIDEFGPEIDKLISDLNAINAAYTTDGTDLISNGDEFAYKMDVLAKKYAKVKAAWEPKQKEADRKFTSDTRYNELVELLNTYEQEATIAHQQSVRHGVNVFFDQYEHIMVTINGQEADPAEGIAAVEGERARLEEMKKNFELTKKTNLPASLAGEVNTYVRYTLHRVASALQGDEYNHVNDAIGGIKYPGVNEKGWRISYYNVAEILNSLFAESDKIDGVDIQAISWVPDPDELDHYIATTTEGAIETYQAVVDALEAIHNAISDIVENAQDEQYIKGDIDHDGDVNILDVQQLINMVGDEELKPEGKDFETADVNGDGNLNIADVTQLINIMMRNEDNGMNRIRQYLGATAGSNSFKVEEVQGENGLRRFAVVLTNEVAFAAGQIDIVLPSHASVAGVSLGDRANALETYVFDNGESTRVVMTSLDNSMIEGNNGCVLFIDVEGNAEINVDNVIFSDVNGNAYELSNTGSGVDGIYDSIKNGVKAIYNAAGQKLNKMTRGVNIIRNADGTVTKKIGK